MSRKWKPLPLTSNPYKGENFRRWKRGIAINNLSQPFRVGMYERPPLGQDDRHSASPTTVKAPAEVKQSSSAAREPMVEKCRESDYQANALGQVDGKNVSRDNKQDHRLRSG